MNYTYNFIRNIQRFLSLLGNSNIKYSADHVFSNINHNNVCEKFLVGSIGPDFFKTPAIIATSVLSLINDPTTATTENIVALPITRIENTYYNRSNVRGFDSLFSKIYRNSVIYKYAFQNNDTPIYAGPGIILDNNFNPLLLWTVEGTWDNIHENSCTVTDCVLYINPIVFSDQNNSLYKGIIKKIIPYITSNEFICNNPYLHFMPYSLLRRYPSLNNNIIHKNLKVKVVIGSMDEFIVAPEKPTDLDKSFIKNTILNNIDLSL